MEIVAKVLKPFADRIDRVAVFGSRALGTAHHASDIDLALYGTLSEAEVARIWTLFDQSPLAVTVDIADYPRLVSSSFRCHIDKVAKTLFTREQLKAAA